MEISETEFQGNGYEINTGIIFRALTNGTSWKNYDREFLLKTIQEVIKEPLTDKNCPVKKDEPHFDLFFALQYSFSKVPREDKTEVKDVLEILAIPTKRYDPTAAVEKKQLEADDFLEHHLANSFKYNKAKFNSFLKSLCHQHKDLLSEQHIRYGKKFIEMMTAAEKEWDRRDKIRDKISNQSEPYEIETSRIYRRLKEDWKNYDREFLTSKVQEAIEIVHKENDVMTYYKDGTPYMKGKIKGTVDWIDSQKSSADDSPLAMYYLGGRYMHELCIVAMDEPCIVERKYKNDTNEKIPEYDILFAVHYSLTRINECSDFLNFHLKKYFNNDVTDFKEFMENVCLEYTDFLHKKHEPFYKKFIETVKNQEPHPDIITPVNNREGNDFIVSTIEDFIHPFKDNNAIAENEYNTLNELLQNFFTKNKTVKLSQHLFVKNGNKKQLGFALGEIYKSLKNEPLSYEYLILGKDNISIFKDEKIDKTNYNKSNLYKYYTSKP